MRPVVILQTSLLSFSYDFVAPSRATPRRRSGRFPQLRPMRGQKLLRADAHAPWLAHELAVYNAAASTDSESARSDPPHADVVQCAWQAANTVRRSRRRKEEKEEKQQQKQPLPMARATERSRLPFPLCGLAAHGSSTPTGGKERCPTREENGGRDL